MPFSGRRGAASRINHVNFTLNRFKGELVGFRFQVVAPRHPGIILPPEASASWRFQFLVHLFPHTKADL